MTNLLLIKDKVGSHDYCVNEWQCYVKWNENGPSILRLISVFYACLMYWSLTIVYQVSSSVWGIYKDRQWWCKSSFTSPFPTLIHSCKIWLVSERMRSQRKARRYILEDHRIGCCYISLREVNWGDVGTTQDCLLAASLWRCSQHDWLGGDLTADPGHTDVWMFPKRNWSNLWNV